MDSLETRVIRFFTYAIFIFPLMGGAFMVDEVFHLGLPMSFAVIGVPLAAIVTAATLYGMSRRAADPPRDAGQTT